MKKKISLLILILASIASVSLMAKKQVLKSTKDTISLIVDGKEAEGGWTIEPTLNPDIFRTMAKDIVFASDIDTLRITLDKLQSKSFQIVNAKGDTANVKVIRISDNPYEEPDSDLTRVSSSGLLSREQAAFDIKALIYNLNEIHPDIFSVCRQEDLLNAVNRAIYSLPDSISKLDLYRRAAPIVAMIGDGHTNLGFPFNDVLTKELKRFPVFVKVLSDKSIICTSCIDSIIKGGDKILSINGISSEKIIDSMLPYVSGEREHFKLSRIDGAFNGLRQMLYPADSFEVEYLPAGSDKPKKVNLPGTQWDDLIKRVPKSKRSHNIKDYSFEIDTTNNVAIMDFRSFVNPSKMEVFADSMFRTLKEKRINNLIIDIRNNGGGNSYVGDILLRYISPEPFVQMEKMLMKVTPVSSKLMNYRILPTLDFYETSEKNYIKPRTKEEGHFIGNVYLLTSNKTFSSAGSFAWTFKECKTGMVIGEETGGMNVCYGDILRYRMPVSGLNCTVSFKRFWQLRADENDIHGTLPDIAVPASEALNSAINHIKTNK